MTRSRWFLQHVGHSPDALLPLESCQDPTGFSMAAFESLSCFNRIYGHIHYHLPVDQSFKSQKINTLHPRKFPLGTCGAAKLGHGFLSSDP